MKLVKIETGNFMADGGALFGVIPKVMWEEKYPADEDNYCNLAMRCLLVDTGERKVLIDTGAGAKQSAKFFSWHRLNGEASLLNSLTSAGYKPSDITDVILTHLHWDHCGGCVYYDEQDEPKVRFDNANHWVSEAQWQNYVAPNSREGVVYFPDNMQPIFEAGLLKVVQKDAMIMDHIEVRILNGHTQGNMLPIIHSPQGLVAFMGDVIPVLPSIRLPWVSAYDTMPIESIKEKQMFLKEAVEKGICLFFEHDCYNECATVAMGSKGFGVDKLFTLNEWSNLNSGV
ncbi:MBL fold metallo-hydrolase [Carboxylicivirga sediminis]|uniref:MBL fold metallo-hydrolase n=1 Tax=Carboxylicivirga sediminis TaxID=2006564 RepID=A0A941IXQ8_9BACT|nr:MBL fold metallo-hydrolase [Carboxylicivirga sediminis]MBR8537061.1 MBL fold metallo-hydrolase [Carboxylicivirga sediminis]